MDIKRALPRPELRSVVRSFEERRADLGSAVLTWPVAARPHQILDVHLAEPYQVRLDGGPARPSPEAGGRAPKGGARSDTVWARSRATGVDPRSGKPVTIDVVDICRFADGKLVEHWGVPDRFALLHQIGALPPPPKRM